MESGKWKYVWFDLSFILFIFACTFLAFFPPIVAGFCLGFSILWALMGIGATLQEILEHLKR